MTRALRGNKFFWFVTAPLLAVIIFLSVFGSRILINPGKIEVTPCGDVVMFRNYPAAEWLGVNYPMVRYVTTITPLSPETNRGYVCREDNGRGQRYNHDHNRGFGKWEINHYATPCMKDPVGFIWETKYQAYLFDTIPLRPITVGAVVVTRNTGWEKCPFSNLEP